MKHGIRSLRETFENLKTSLNLDEQGILTVHGKEIAMVYYRTGYQKEQFVTIIKVLFKLKSNWSSNGEIRLLYK